MLNSIYSKTYKKLDLIFVFTYYFYIFILSMLYFKIITNNIHYFNNTYLKLIANISLNLFQLIPIIIFIRYRGQSFKDIGIYLNNIYKLIFKGVLYFVPLLIIDIIFSDQKISFNTLFSINSIIQLVTIALIEEIIFRGFIQSRLFGIFKNKVFALILGSLMFSLIHSNKFLIIGFTNISLISFLIGSLRLSLKHIYYTFITNNTNSIIPSTISHFLNNILS